MTTQLSAEELQRLEHLKQLWPSERLVKEAYGEYIPSAKTLSYWKFAKWKYQHKLLKEKNYND